MPPAHSRWWPLAAVVLVVAYAVIATVFARQARPNADEGFYAAAARATAEGLMPYRDFGYTQPPVLPYVQGAVMRLTGFGVRELRGANVLWGACCLAAMLVIWRRHGTPAWSVVLAAGTWLGSAAAMYFSVVGKTYGFAQLALVLAAAALLPAGPAWARFCWLALWGTVAVGSRLTVAPAVIVLWIGLVAQQGRRTPLAAALVAPAVAAALLFGPFVHAAPQNLRFWIWDYHLLNHDPKAPGAALLQSLGFAPALALLGGLGAFAAARRSCAGPALWWLAAGLVGWITAVASSGIYGEYAAPLWPLVVLGAGAALPALAERRWLPWACAAALAVVLASALWRPTGPRQQPWLEPGYLASLDRAAAVLAEHTRPDDLVLASMPEVPLVAGRAIPRELLMGKFNLTLEIPGPEAERLGMMTFDRLVAAVEARTPAAVVAHPSSRWSFGLSMPSVSDLSPGTFARFSGPLKSGYDLAHADAFFRVYVRKPAPAPAPGPREPGR